MSDEAPQATVVQLRSPQDLHNERRARLMVKQKGYLECVNRAEEHCVEVIHYLIFASMIDGKEDRARFEVLLADTLDRLRKNANLLLDGLEAEQDDVVTDWAVPGGKP